MISGTNNAEVTGTVATSLTDFEKALVDNLGLRFVLKCKLWGEDDTSPDDGLFNFANKTITASGLSTFRTTISRNTLDEDDDDWTLGGDDEVYARYTLKSTEPTFLFCN